MEREPTLADWRRAKPLKACISALEHLTQRYETLGALARLGKTHLLLRTLLSIKATHQIITHHVAAIADMLARHQDEDEENPAIEIADQTLYLLHRRGCGQALCMALAAGHLATSTALIENAMDGALPAEGYASGELASGHPLAAAITGRRAPESLGWLLGHGVDVSAPAYDAVAVDIDLNNNIATSTGVGPWWRPRRWTTPERPAAAGWTPVHCWAAGTHPHPEVLSLLTAGGKSDRFLEAADAHGRTPLLVAASNGFCGEDDGGAARAVEALLGVHLARFGTVRRLVAARDDGGRGVLHHCVRSFGGAPCCAPGAADALRVAIAAGADLDAAGEDRATALLDAAAALDVADARHAAEALRCVRALLAAGADPNAKDRCGTSPLHAAAVRGASAACGALLRHGAAVDAVDTRGRTPLARACEGGHWRTAEFLIEAGGAKVDAASIQAAKGFEALRPEEQREKQPAPRFAAQTLSSTPKKRTPPSLAQARSPSSPPSPAILSTLLLGAKLKQEQAADRQEAAGGGGEDGEGGGQTSFILGSNASLDLDSSTYAHNEPIFLSPGNETKAGKRMQKMFADLPGSR